MTTAADIIAARLYEAGVRHAFGIPGGEVLALIDALARAGVTVEIARHENAAGFMAEGAWHGTGAPGVLVATVGPGAANTVNVAANAEQDRVPLIILTGRIAEADALTFTHQVFDHQKVLGPLCKASFEAREGAADVLIDKAIRLALDPQPGPVHIDVPIPVATAPHPEPAPVRRAPVSPAAPAPGADLEAARERFRAAERPVLLAGLDALATPAAAPQVRSVAERFALPVLTTYKAKGIIPETAPLSLGGHGLSPKSDAVALPLLGAADLVILAGYDPIEMRSGWRAPWAPEAAVSFSARPNTHHMHHEALAWTCDVGAGLAALTEGAARKPLWPGREPAEARAALAAAFAPTGSWGAREALHILNELKPAGGVTTVDSGAHRILLSQIWTCDAPGQLLQSTGLCTMGCALPMATGRALAGADAPVLAVMGDGCLDMVLGELATLRDLGAPVIVVVLVDGSYALIEKKQRAMGLQAAAVDFGRTDYVALAAALGLPGWRAADSAALRAAVPAALSVGGPALIAIEIDARGYDGEI